MPIPDFQTIMLPMLRYAGDGAERTTREAVDVLADQFALTQDEREQLLPSGTQRSFANRVAWSVSYLKQAGLVESPSRGHFRITDGGREALKSPPPRITIKYLAELSPEFRELREVPFSVVPCRPRWIEPNLAMGAKATVATDAELRTIWQTIVGQVVGRAGLALGVELEPPRELVGK